MLLFRRHPKRDGVKYVDTAHTTRCVLRCRKDEWKWRHPEFCCSRML